MDTKTKNKISASLKNYHHHKKVISDCKAVAGFIILIATVSILIKLGTPTILADDTARYAFLPKNEDRQEMTIAEQIMIIAKKEQFEDVKYLIDLAFCESSLNIHAIGVNGNGTIDRGVFQINDYWHKDVSTEQAMDLDFATRWTIDKIKAGKQHFWTCDRLIN